MTGFRHLLLIATTAAGLLVSASQGFAQQPDVGDQPGLLPDDAVQLDPEFRKQMVYYRTSEPPGTIIVATAERHLYLVQGNGRALRYGIGVGRDGFQWQGLLNITRKAEWPDWTPPPEMIQRQPYLPRFMAGGPGNPLGARAMYLGTTVYRIHGTNRPDTIGTAVSSGCFAWSMPTWPTSTTGYPSAPRLSCASGRNYSHDATSYRVRHFTFFVEFFSSTLARDKSCGHSEAAS